ncbi:hypothetical protein [Psychrobacillus sp. L3]|uniref:hypothetical protein n=1 Tax=Psychrobacillus sp. L3 TaxID=3236891 RepID=UPI0036F23E2C
MIITIFIAAISFFLDFYPGGYSLQNENTVKVTLIKKGFLEKEQFEFEVTTENELKIALLKNEVNYVKSLWFMSLLVFPTVLSSLVTYYYFKNKQVFFLILTFFILLISLDIYSIIKSLNFIEKLLMGLITM